MFLQEPQVEFVPISTSDAIATSLTSNYETCNGDNAYSNACSANSIKWADNAGIVGCNHLDPDEYEWDNQCVS